MNETRERITIIVERDDSEGNIWKDAIDIDPKRIDACADPISISDALDNLREEVKRAAATEAPGFITPLSREWKKVCA